MKKLTKIALAGLMLAGVSANATAQDAMACDVTFVPAVYERWPHADDACMGIVTRDDGNEYAKFTAQVVSQSPSGTFVRYKLRDGSMTPSRRVNPPEGFEAMIAGQATAIRDLNPRQEVNLYLPAAAWAQPEPVAAAAPPPPPPPPPEPEPEPVMPTTAGNFGWLAIFGGLFLLLGGALRFTRQQ